MAAAVVPASAIDLKTPGTFHVRLGASVLKDGEPRRYRNVRYNYKPQPTQGANVTSKMLPGKQANASTISMKDGDKEWEYTGRSREDEEMYVLVITGDGKKDVVLEKLGSSHTMNLTRTPEEKDVESLARKHPYLLENDSDNDDEAMFGDEDDTRDTTPDADNPFDFRHFLKSVEATSQREEPSSQPNRSTAGTPLHKPPTSTPTSRASKPAPSTAAAKKRKTPSAAATRPNPKRVKAGEDPTPTSTPSTKPKPKPQAVPEVRVERKATLPAPSIEQPSQPPSQPDYEDDGELILENSTPDTSQKPTHLSAMSLALSGHLGNRGSGPISLRSAASSPASRINSPHLNGAAKQEGEEFELGGDSSPEQEQHHFEFSYDDDDEVGGDGDVEDSVVPSPPQPEPARQPAAQPRSRRASLAVPAADDEDDMEAQLALAMAAEEEDEEPAPLARVDESDEDVSEEE